MEKNRINNGLRILILVVLCLCVVQPVAAQTKSSDKKPEKVTEAKLGETRNVHQCGTLYLAGQFSVDDISAIKQSGVTRVITLRTEGEIEWDEATALKNADLDYIEVPFRSPDSLTDEVFDKIRQLLAKHDEPTLFHCGSANRVGGVWLPYRVLDEGVDLETALKEAKAIGLRSEAYQRKALDYIRRKQEEKQRKQSSGADQGINRRFLDPNLEVDDYVRRFEMDNREVYAVRSSILRECDLKPGQRVADIGAGTGFFTRLFSDEVGEQGWIFAVDISPRFIEHINQSSIDQHLNNITGVLCRQDSVNLPPSSIDVAFICDTYHHFEQPESSLHSIHQALKPGGQLLVVDFERIEGKSRPFILGHVRAGKETVRDEILGAGFRLVGEVEIPKMDENYFLRFKKQ